MSSESFMTPVARNQTEVFAIHGRQPRSAGLRHGQVLPLRTFDRESLAEISAQRAEQFLNTFYFQYGHRSIADLAHVAMSIERLSLLALWCWLTSRGGMARNDQQGIRTSSNRAGFPDFGQIRFGPSFIPRP